MEYISPAFRLEFREFCVRLYLGQIDDIFQMSGIQAGSISPERSINGARRTRVEEYYASIDWTNLDDILKFLRAVGLVISQSYIDEKGKNQILDLCKKEGLVIDGYQIKLPDKETDIEKDLFKSQFPGGLPFGIPKPDFAITAENGGQSLKFELKTGIGIIWKDVYPCYYFQLFQEACGITSSTNLALKKALLVMNQTESEKAFFQSYAKHFSMVERRVPFLIPQAWIQWHSSSKRNLIANKSTLAQELCRVDFVAFWKNERYAILIDDISHYAIKIGNRWIADEKAYSKRLQEDRKLRVEGWHIYRISNWEIRDSQIIMEILSNLQSFIGF